MRLAKATPAFLLASLWLGACDAQVANVIDAATARDAQRADAHDLRDAARTTQPFRLRWTRVRTDLPYVPWETAIAYDPRAHRLVQHGGHVLGSYVQSSYTTLLDLASNEVHYATPASRPQRRCITDLVYASSLGVSISVDGGAEHGSLPSGIVAEDGTRVRRGGGGVGPWLYDGVHDAWEDARPPGLSWPASAHTPIVYEPGSDAVFAIVGDVLMVYEVAQNRVTTRALPDVLHGRLAYGIAADPLTRNIVVFGGSGRRIWIWERDPLANYESEVWRDTWIYEPGSDTWREVVLGEAPPRGVPMADHTELPMVFDPASRSALLLQTPLTTPTLDFTMWPSMELWRFDFASESWTESEMVDAPEWPGLLAYDADHHAFVHVGGGRETGRPATSQHLYTGVVEGAEVVDALPRISLTVEGASDVRISLETAASVALTVERAEVVDGMPQVYSAVGSIDANTTTWSGTLPDAHAYAFRLVSPTSASHAAFTLLPRPAHAIAHHDVSAVQVRWDAVPNARGYHVYRGAGETAVLEGELTRITSVPITETRFTDTSLSSTRIQAYVVRAVDARGVEGAPSAVAYSAPDAPVAVDARVEGNEIVLTWELPASLEGATVTAFATNTHRNTLGFTTAQWEAFWAEWQAVGSSTTTSLRVPFNPTEAHPHLYLYVRTSNALDQMGFYSDIVSPTDVRFRPARRDAPGG